MQNSSLPSSLPPEPSSEGFASTDASTESSRQSTAESSNPGYANVRYLPPVAVPPAAIPVEQASPTWQPYPSAHVGDARAPLLDRTADRVLAVQRPIVLAHLRSLRSRNPHATPAQLTRKLEARYLSVVTAGGAAVGATAAVPGVGTVAALALSSAETVGFLEATALYAQSLAELHGITITNPDRARILVLTLLVGDEGLMLLRQVTGQASGGSSRKSFWGELVSSALPRQLVAPVVDQLKSLFVRKAAKAGTASVIGKAMPYGIGAVIGGTGNHVLARRVIARSRTAFGPAPLVLPHQLASIEPKEPKPKRERKPKREPMRDSKRIKIGKRRKQLEP